MKKATKSKKSAASSQPAHSMRYNKQGFTKINSDNISTASSTGVIGGNGPVGARRIYVPKATEGANPGHEDSDRDQDRERGLDQYQYQQQEDEGGETDAGSIEAMPSEETPLRRRTNGYQRECGKTFLAIFSLFVSTLLGAFVIAYIHGYSVSDGPPLPDLIFLMVPWQIWAWEAADVTVIVVSLFTFAVVLFHKYFTIVYRRLFFLAAILYLVRALFLLCTYLPPPFPDWKTRCLPANFSQDWKSLLAQTFGLVFQVGFSSNEKRIMCGDTIYSGHTMVFALMCLIMWSYTPKPLQPFPAVLVISGSTFGLTCVIISRQHYTIDAVVAIFVTCSLFYWYQSWTMRSRERCCFSAKPFRFRPFLYIFLYFEGNVPRGRLPNELAWPFPVPEICIRLFARWNESHMTKPESDSGDVERRIGATSGERRPPSKTRIPFDV